MTVHSMAVADQAAELATESAGTPPASGFAVAAAERAVGAAWTRSAHFVAQWRALGASVAAAAGAARVAAAEVVAAQMREAAQARFFLTVRLLD